MNRNYPSKNGAGDRYSSNAGAWRVARSQALKPSAYRHPLRSEMKRRSNIRSSNKNDLCLRYLLFRSIYRSMNSKATFYSSSNEQHSKNHGPEIYPKTVSVTSSWQKLDHLLVQLSQDHLVSDIREGRS